MGAILGGGVRGREEWQVLEGFLEEVWTRVLNKERVSTPSNSGGFGFAIPLSPLLGFPGTSAGKESTCNAGDLGSIPGLGRSPGERNGYPLQYSGLENSMDYTVHGVAKSWTQLHNFRTHTFPTLTTIKKLQ